MVVITFKKLGKQQLIYVHSSPGAVNTLSTSPPKYTSQENAYEMEKEKLKETDQVPSDTKQEGKDSPETPQDHSCDETGM